MNKPFVRNTLDDQMTEILRQERQDRISRWAGRAFAFVAGAGMVAALTYGCVDAVVKTTEIQERHYSAPPMVRTEQQAYAEFFQRHGSPVPAQMAQAIMAVKPHNRPVLASVAIVESGGDPQAVGDNGASKGAFQVQPRHWGVVSISPVQQALQAEKILESLLVEQRGVLRRGLQSYNGGVNPPRSSQRYADRVLALSRRTP